MGIDMRYPCFRLWFISVIYAYLGFSQKSEIKIGVIFEKPFWTGNTSLIVEKAIIASALIQNGSTSFGIVQRNVVDAIEASESVCLLSENGSQVIMSFVDCKTAKFLDSQATRLSIPQVFFIDKACKMERSGNFSVVFQPHFSLFGKAAVSVARYINTSEVGLLYDEMFDSIEVHEFLTAMSTKFITTRLLRLDSGAQNGSVHEIENHLTTIQLLNLPTFVCITNEHTKLFFEMAIKYDMLGHKHFWVFFLRNVDDTYARLANRTGSNVVFIGRNQTIHEVLGHDSSDFSGIRGVLLQDAFETVLLAITNSSDLHMTTVNDCNQRPPALAEQSRQIAESIFTVDRVGHSGKLSFDDSKYLTDIRYAIYSTGKTNGSTLIPVGEWNTTAGLTLFDNRLFYNTFKDFDNELLIVGSIELEPFAMKKITENGTQWVGFCFSILNELATQLNFRYIIKEPDDNMWGAENEDGTWNGVVGEVKRGEVAFGVGSFTITSVREQVIDFTKPYLEDGVGIIMRRNNEDPAKMFKMFQPFQSTVWAFTTVAVICVGLALFVTNRFSPFTMINRRDDINPDDQKSLKENLWLVFGTYMEQGGEPRPSAVSGRVVLVFWWVFTLLMASTYTANLAAFLTITITKKPINSLLELATQSAIKPTSIYSSNIYSAFQNSDNDVYQMIWKSLSQSPISSETSDHLRLVKTGQYAFLDDRLSLEYTALSDCETYTLADEIFNTAGYGFLLPEGAPFIDAFNYNIIKMQEAGLTAKWKKEWWPRSDRCSSKDTKSGASILDLDSLGGLFLVYGGVCLCSLLCLVFETFIRSSWRKTVTKKLKRYFTKKTAEVATADNKP